MSGPAVALARLNGLGRAAFGVGMLAAPETLMRPWIGKEAGRAGARTVTRALGARDLVLGLLTLHVAGRPGVNSRTVATLAAVDAVDLAATAAARGRLPSSAAGVMAVAGASAASLVAVAAALRRSAPGA